MTVAGELAHVTSELTHRSASTTPVTPTRDGLDAALHARAAVIALAAQVLRDVSTSPLKRVPTIADLHDQPARTLHRALLDHPPVAASQSPIDVARAAAPDSVSATWERLAASVSAVHLGWTQMTGMPNHFSHPARPGVTADIALTVLALTRSEPAMAAAARAIGDHTSADALTRSQAAPLRFAAEATWRASPPDRRSWDVALPVDGRRLGVLSVPNAAALPHGLHRLSQLLHADIPIAPQHVASLVNAQARLALALSQRLPLEASSDSRAVGDAGAPDVTRSMSPLTSSRDLIIYARRLAAAWSHRDNALATIQPASARQLQQAGECVRALPVLPRGLPTSTASLLPRHAVAATAAGLRETLVATCAAIDRQVEQGRWISSHVRGEESSPARRWYPVGVHTRPDVADALHALRESQGLPIAHLTTARLVAHEARRPTEQAAQDKTSTPTAVPRSIH